MPRPKIYPNEAARQKAYRLRKRPPLHQLVIPLTPAELLRLEKVAKSLYLIPEKYARELLLAAVRSIEGEPCVRDRRKSRGSEK